MLRDGASLDDMYALDSKKTDATPFLFASASDPTTAALVAPPPTVRPHGADALRVSTSIVLQRPCAYSELLPRVSSGEAIQPSIHSWLIIEDCINRLPSPHRRHRRLRVPRERGRRPGRRPARARGWPSGRRLAIYLLNMQSVRRGAPRLETVIRHEGHISSLSSPLWRPLLRLELS